jgi:folate-binding protein YgfZ
MTSAPSSLAPGFDRTPHFSAVGAEYDALRTRVAVIDRSARLRMLFSGAKPAETLTGLVTSDVIALHPGYGQFGAALTNKGKIITDVRILARADDLLIDVPEAGGTAFASLIRKMVNPRLARYADVSGILRTVTLAGPLTAPTLDAVFGAGAGAVVQGAPFSHHTVPFADVNVLVATVPDLGGIAVDCFVPVEAAHALWDALVAAGATPVGRDATEVARVEAGWPAVGADMTEETLAQEANIDVLGGVSYTKGCYTGQETVARIHFRGHVNKHLRGVRSAEPLAAGATLTDATGELVGDVRSAVSSPAEGHIAIAMVRRTIEVGATLTARGADRESSVTLTELPFR